MASDATFPNMHGCRTWVHHPDGDRQCTRRGHGLAGLCAQHRAVTGHAEVTKVPAPDAGPGGRREGSGRPRLAPDVRRVTVTLPAEVVKYLHRLGCGNVSRGVRVLYDAYARGKKPEDG